MRAPLSPSQERLWLLQRLDPADASYTMYNVRRLRGPLDEAALEGALADVVARHEGLRTRFEEEDGVPWAVAEPPGAAGTVPPVQRIRADDEEHARRIVAERVNAPFDLAEGVPLRVALITIGALDHVLCVTMHHIIGDGWSLGILFDDLAECYTARLHGRAPSLAPLPVQPSDYARWQRRRAERAVPYWQERLADPPPPDLPCGMGNGGEGQGDFQVVRLGREIAAELDRLARENRTTLFTVLMAAYQVLLHRHTGHTDVLVGTAVAGRDRVELEPMIGYLSQTVVLRGDLDGDPSFTELLARTRQEALTALSRPSVPFERIGHPAEALMPTMFILHTQDLGLSRAFGDLSVGYFPDGYRQVKLGLYAEAWFEDGEIVVSFGHDGSSGSPHEAEAVRRLADRFLLLVESAVAEPRRRISELRVWTGDDEADIRAMAGDGADTAGAAGSETVPEMIAEVVRRTPHAVAVVCGETEVTYGELDRRAARLAAALRARGVRPGEVVGVCLPRSVEAITALLAVWRAGAAYLPFEPEEPEERLAFSLADAGATHVITTRALPAGLTAVGPLAGEDEAALGDRGEPQETRPGDLAYVISTSGSTGRPKGVAVEHRAIAARIRWMREEYGLAPGDRVVQFASLSFDTHLEEVFPTLAAGAALVLLPGGAATLPDLLAAPGGERVTMLDLPTAYWHHLVEEIDQIAWPPALRLVVIGGEQASGGAVARWHGRFGDRVRLVNTYGPTEAAVIATATDLGPTPYGRPPIGRPVGATTVHVLDAAGAPVPKGVIGELVIGGAGVARGYLRRPALTAAAFVPDPLGPPGSRRYRTGDRARWNQDGTLEFLGRLDGQLKVRGFRIEPGEVEARLLDHPGVGQAFVTVHAEELVAYVTGTATGEELAAHLARTLPRHLVPTAWVVLDALPLTSRGKVDRAALPAPVRASSAGHVAPSTDAELLVAEIWSELLGVDTIGVNDDFFTLGGHSLLATRIAARLRRATGVEVPVRTIFERRTVAELAVALEDLLVAELEEISDEEAERLLSSADL
ncbi:amino acid adenylation domain-containing protein [Microbispora sp. SCL1-1]|uniref:non-ribosomal peptide synthetase n=1 Tax=Microbispora TaxID=2005 RepID=UPI0011574DB9|nr:MULTISPECIES: non-ribosomal peptide synthetase [unclassified Microbispora]NJP25876.1 amino acid adenylation domain-containing protein [Microbispora sp. CL1-1]TQS13002.1 amino acid adenylation domain-containing protein [Microbispora sp. SCL1-1]